MIRVKKYSPISHKYNEMDIPITQEEFRSWTKSGLFLDEYFPHLTRDQKEFLISGITPEEWMEMFGTPNDM